MANDNGPGSSEVAAAAATNTGMHSRGNNDLPPPSATAATSSSHSEPMALLQRNSSITSTHSHSSKSSIGRRAMSGSSGSGASFPASPALSTLSRNSRSSSSGGSSLASSAARMSVDDILSMGGRQKAMRKVAMTAGPAKPHLKPVAVHSSSANNVHHMRRQPSAQSEQSSSSASKRRDVPNPILNPGQEERKRRLERLQKEQLQRRLLAQQKQKQQRQSSLDRLKKMEEEDRASNDVSSIQSSQGTKPGEAHSNIDKMPIENDAEDAVSTQSSQSDEKKVASKQKASPEPTPVRRSKRAKTVSSSYNVADLAKNTVISEVNVMPSSLPVASEEVEVKPRGETKHDAMSESESSNKATKRGSVKTEKSAPPSSTDAQDAALQEDQLEEDNDEPDSAKEALAALLANYDSCINQVPLKVGGRGNEVISSPWKVVQLLVWVLIRYINLHDPESQKSKEYKDIEAGMAEVVKSVDRMKWEVMNRNTSGGEESMSKKDNAEDAKEEEVDAAVAVALKEAKLLTMILVQVWIRMMVWNSEQDEGWAFLGRVLALAEEDLDEPHDMGSTGKKGKKSKKKKKKSKKAKQQQSNDASSPRDSLVAEIRSLMELTPYVLPPSLEFAQWLKDTLTFSFRQPVPEYGPELFDHFEIEVSEPIALRRHGTDTSRRSERSEVSHSPVKERDAKVGSASVGGNVGGTSPTKQLMDRRQKRQQAYFASLAEEEKASSNNSKADDETATITGSVSTVTSTSRTSRNSIREKDDTILFKTSVSLTATEPSKSSNPFLKGSARGNYVGSHLSAKLANITSLFREVKAPPKPKPKPKAKKPVPQATEKERQTSLLAKQLRPAVRSVNVTADVAVPSTAAAGLKKRNSNISSAKMRLLASSPTKETPRKRLRPSSSANSSKVSAAATLPSFSVEETPAQKRHRPASAATKFAASSFSSRALAPMPTIEETPLKQQIIDETPAKRKRPPGRRIEGRFATGNFIVAETPQMGNSIVAETPQQQLQQRGAMRNGASSVMPTNLWQVQQSSNNLSGKPPGRQIQDSRLPRHQQQHYRSGRGPEHLSPVFNQGSAMLSFSHSPMPYQEDMEGALARLAKAKAAKRSDAGKKKK